MLLQINQSIKNFLSGRSNVNHFRNHCRWGKYIGPV